MRKKILVISKVHTHPINMGNSMAIVSQTDTLQKLGAEVDFLFVQERGLNKSQQCIYDDEYQQTKRYWGNHFLYLKVSRPEKVFRNLLSMFRKAFCNRHEGTYDKYPLELTAYVRKLQKEKRYDACLVNYYYLTKLFKYVSFSQMACFTHDAMAYKNLTVGEPCLWINAEQEARALQLCTDLFAIQDEEYNYFHILSPQSRVYNIYSAYTYHPTPVINNKNIVFLSGDNCFNQNGLRWFVQEVLPRIKEKYQDAKLIVAGGICKVLKDKYENVDGVELMGYVKDPMDLYVRGDVAINPVYQGTGLKIKTFEAISYDKITLVHPHSLTGVFKKDKAPLFASDKPEDWVRFLDSVWNDPKKIITIKAQNSEYIFEMNNYIVNEYKRFLNI